MESESIYEFVKSKLAHIQNIEFTDRSSFFLNQLIHLCKTTYKTQTKIQQKNTMTLSDHTMDMELVPEDIKTYINDAPFKQVYSCSFTIGQRQINIHTMVFKRTRKVAFVDMLEKVQLWLTMACNLASDICSPVMNIQFFMTDFEKKLPNTPKMPLNVIHANTALTYGCMKNEPTTITVFRIEEWFKVFIHETFHCLGLDFSHHTKQEAEAKTLLKKTFHVDSPLCISETYAEIWADIMNIIVFHTLQNMPLAQINVQIERELNVERKYAIFQAAKVLQYYGYKYEDCLLQPKNKLMTFIESETNTFCYYVVRALLMYNLNGFLEWCVKNNQGSIVFMNENVNVAKFVQELVIAKSRDTRFNKLINKSQEILKNCDVGISGTLRMTVFG